MSFKTIQQLEDDGITSERVTFTCSGCGRDTTVHVGIRSAKGTDRCVRCSDTLTRIPTAKQTGRIGTHGGIRIKDEALRARRRAKSLRSKRTRLGEPFRAPCANYGCEGHRRHSQPTPQRTAGKGVFGKR